MKLREIIQVLNAEVILDGEDQDMEIGMACASDLMSDVLAFAKAGALLMTGLTTTQVVYTAEMADTKVVCFVRGKKPSTETIELARSRGIILLRTTLPMFESCGRLYKNGLKGCSET
ncbi:MAG: hypothetical protein FJ215_13475 [Ignavibacteria bacterium]|nr:hypothetical protein [Ignavibacteria bacterium]